MNHGCQDETSYNSFESLYHQVHQINPFILKHGPEDILQKSEIFVKSKKSETSEENSLCANPFLRESQFLNVFVVQLLNSSA
jgi:hypothetical protein